MNIRRFLEVVTVCTLPLTGVISAHAQTIRVRWEEIGLSGEHALRDLWPQKDIGSFADGVSVKVSASGCAILKVEQ